MTETIINPCASNLIWIDLEMSGLDPEKDCILEICTVVTDKNLNVLAEGPVYAIHQPDSILDSMDEWNTKHHNKSGLVEHVKESNINEEQAEADTIEFLMQYVPPGKSPMCGNTVCQDRRFLYRYMPKLVMYFHYRNLDVSTIKLLAKHWYPSVFNGFKGGKGNHRACSDVYASIDELRYYREHFIRLPKDVTP